MKRILASLFACVLILSMTATAQAEYGGSSDEEPPAWLGIGVDTGLQGGTGSDVIVVGEDATGDDVVTGPVDANGNVLPVQDYDNTQSEEPPETEGQDPSTVPPETDDSSDNSSTGTQGNVSSNAGGTATVAPKPNTSAPQEVPADATDAPTEDLPDGDLGGPSEDEVEDEGPAFPSEEAPLEEGDTLGKIYFNRDGFMIGEVHSSPVVRDDGVSENYRQELSEEAEALREHNRALIQSITPGVLALTAPHRTVGLQDILSAVALIFVVVAVVVLWVLNHLRDRKDPTRKWLR